MKNNLVLYAAFAAISGLGAISTQVPAERSGERATRTANADQPAKSDPIKSSETKSIRRVGSEPNPSSPANIKRHLPISVAAMRRASHKRKNVARNKSNHRGARA